MRTLVDITEKQISELAVISKNQNVSRAEIIRKAIQAYIEKNRPTSKVAFGIWKKHKVDGLAYQEKVRSEW